MASSVTIASEPDVRRAIDSVESLGRRGWLIVALAIIPVALDSYAQSALSASLDPLTQGWGLSPLQVSWLTAAAPAAALPTSLFGGRLADRLGRLPVIVVAELMALAASQMAAFAPNYLTLVGARVGAGLAFGLVLGTALAYVAEYLPSSRSGKVNNWQSLWYIGTTGNLVLAVSAYYLGAGNGVWHWSLGSTGVIAAITLPLQLYWMPESPLWLASQGKLARAASALRKGYNLEVRILPSASDSPTQSAVQKSRPHSQYAVSDLFRSPYRSRTVMANIINLTQTFQYFAVGWYLPTISASIFGTGFGVALLGSAAFNSVGIVGGALAGSFAGKLGMRKFTAICEVIICAVLVTMGLTSGSIPIAVAVVLPTVFLFFHAAGPGGSGVGMATLAYPSGLRATGGTVATLFASLGGAIGVFLSPLLRDALGPSTSLVVLAAAPAVGLLPCLVVRWEPLADGEKDKAAPDSREEPVEVGS